MDVLIRFKRYIEENKLFNIEDKLLLAVSGGRDSMLLLWLCHQAGIDMVVAHCNFNLRGAESDGDEELVRTYCAQHKIPFYKRDFDTKNYSLSRKISIQMAARELRYRWFESLRLEIGAKAILIAQHMNDHVETVLFNMSRGTGLKGLSGIHAIKEGSAIIRPLLFLTHKEITAAVKFYEIPYRDDSSNFSNKYARNKIRLDIVPQFEELNPDFLMIMDENIKRFQEADEMLRELIHDLRSQLFLPQNDGSYFIELNNLKNMSLSKHYYLFEPFGFSKSVLADMISCYDGESGRIFQSNSHEILLDRQLLILSTKTINRASKIITADENQVLWEPYNIRIEQSQDTTIEKDQHIAKVDYALLKFPLTIRTWQEGDYFYPLGMNGKKKVSDFFIQQKLNLFEKKYVPILVNGTGEIIWIMNYRMDDRFKMTDNTQKVLKLVCI